MIDAGAAAIQLQQGIRMVEPHQKPVAPLSVKITATAATIVTIGGGILGTVMQIGQAETNKQMSSVTTQMAVIATEMKNLTDTVKELKTDIKGQLNDFDQRLRKVENDK